MDITGATCAPGDEDPLEQVEDEFDRIVMKCHTFQAILLFSKRKSHVVLTSEAVKSPLHKKNESNPHDKP